MQTVLLVIHVMVTVALIVLILVQRSASDGMGLSGSSSSNFLSGRAAASFATRTTAILATIFMLTSLGLGIIASRSHVGQGSFMDGTVHPAPATSAQQPAPATPPASQPVVPRPE